MKPQKMVKIILLYGYNVNNASLSGLDTDTQGWD